MLCLRAEGADTGETAVQGVEEAQGRVSMVLVGNTRTGFSEAVMSRTRFTKLAVALPGPGEVCPTCGHRQAKTAKQRHAEWRAKRKEAKS